MDDQFVVVDDVPPEDGDKESTPSLTGGSFGTHVISVENGVVHYVMGDQQAVIEQFPQAVAESVPSTLCMVCGGRANGIHFGAQSCAACNAFFRRSVAENRQYICRKNGNCLIDAST
ncbi:CRE-NHR-17 protein [Aphelenchoides avenae]|nr:CRE-NHR-17 protein [Aphelenchus avenae]